LLPTVTHCWAPALQTARQIELEIISIRFALWSAYRIDYPQLYFTPHQ